jgi:hypothetical protein
MQGVTPGKERMNASDQEAQLQSGVGQVVYEPPPPELVDRYAREVCREYGAKFNKNTLETEFLQGFKVFVRAVVKAQTNLMNQGRKL